MLPLILGTPGLNSTPCNAVFPTPGLSLPSPTHAMPHDRIFSLARVSVVLPLQCGITFRTFTGQVIHSRLGKWVIYNQAAHAACQNVSFESLAFVV